MAEQCAECGSSSATGRFCTECGATLKVPAVADFSTPVSRDGSANQSANGAAYTRADDAIGRTDSAPSAVIGRSQSSAVSFASTRSDLRRNNSAPSQRSLSQSQPIGLLKSRYSNHPNCDLCNISFDVTKRRHQW
jgi:hypothetical protein